MHIVCYNRLPLHQQEKVRSFHIHFNRDLDFVAHRIPLLWKHTAGECCIYCAYQGISMCTVLTALVSFHIVLHKLFHLYYTSLEPRFTADEAGIYL